MLDIKKLLTVMAEHDASDLYITVDSPPSYRVNGAVCPAGKRCLTPDETEKLARDVMSDKQQVEFEETNELNSALYLPPIGRFRINIFRQKGNVGMVIRQIKSKVPSIEDMNLPDVLKDISMTKRGLVLMVGATGSGKSTSLAAMIDHRNANQAGHIITIEDPVEFMHSHKKSIITQREVGMDTETFHTALKNTLRQAPDVILIGEIRDLDTMEAAISFAETGHLCMATLHSNNANQAMERVLNFFPMERHRQIYLQLSLNLRAIVSQRLIKSSDGGRVAAIEVLLNSPRIADLINKGEVDLIKETMEKSAVVGMQTFDQHLYRHFKAGRITEEDAIKNADSANNLRLKIKLSKKAPSKDTKEIFALTDKEQQEMPDIKEPKKAPKKSEGLSLSLDD